MLLSTSIGKPNESFKLAQLPGERSRTWKLGRVRTINCVALFASVHLSVGSKLRPKLLRIREPSLQVAGANLPLFIQLIASPLTQDACLDERDFRGFQTSRIAWKLSLGDTWGASQGLGDLDEFGQQLDEGWDFARFAAHLADIQGNRGTNRIRLNR